MKFTALLIVGVSFAQLGFSQGLTDGLLAYYKFNGDAVDYSGNGYHATVNGPLLVEDENGNPGSAYYFDGVDDYIDLPNVSALKPEFPFTYSIVVKLENITQVGSCMFTNDFEENNYHGSHAAMSSDGTGRIALTVGGGQGGTSPNNRRTKWSDAGIVPLKWYRLTFITRGATDMDIYIDCVNAGGWYEGTGSTQIAYSSVQGSFGRKDANVGLPPYYFEGTISDFAFWNRELTVDEVESLCSGILGVESTLNGNSDHVIYPNPTNGQFTLNFPTEQHYVVEVFDALGRMVSTEEYENISSTSIELDNPGLYTLVIRSQTGNSGQKLVVQ